MPSAWAETSWTSSAGLEGGGVASSSSSVDDHPDSFVSEADPDEPEPAWVVLRLSATRFALLRWTPIEAPFEKQEWVEVFDLDSAQYLLRTSFVRSLLSPFILLVFVCLRKICEVCLDFGVLCPT